MKNKTGERIKTLRRLMNLTQKELAQKLELKDSTSISKYEVGTRMPSRMVMEKMSKLFDVTMDYLQGISDDPFPPHRDLTGVELVPSKQIPLVKRITGSSKIPSLKEAKELFTIPMSLNADFAYRLKDDSMEPKANAGDILLIKTRDTLEDGEIGLVSIDGRDAVCRQFVDAEDFAVLKAKNEKYKDTIVPKKKLKKRCKIIGAAVAKFERF